MYQYLDLLHNIKTMGTPKPAARVGMPGSLSLFGYQFHHDLKDGFPLLTTKKLPWRWVVEELLWFLKGDTNIKYLVDKNINIWNGDAWNYFRKRFPKVHEVSVPTIEVFLENVINQSEVAGSNYTFGDCGYQYGKVWRKWYKGSEYKDGMGTQGVWFDTTVDQIDNIIKGLRYNPESRRHMLISVDPSHEDDLALYWCHCLAQFNCRPLSFKERYVEYFDTSTGKSRYYHPHYDNDTTPTTEEGWTALMNEKDINVPKYYLDCQLYQRSADVFLGVPFNIASYALFTHILADMAGMIPGTFIHTFGDVHIYDNHMDAVNLQLERTPDSLPKLQISDNIRFDTVDDFQGWHADMFKIVNYNPQPAISAELSTGI